MAHILAQKVMALEPSQHQLVHAKLKDPSNAHTLAQSYTGLHAATLYQNFQQTFLHGFHSVTWFVVVMVIMTLVGLIFASRCRSSK